MLCACVSLQTTSRNYAGGITIWHAGAPTGIRAVDAASCNRALTSHFESTSIDGRVKSGSCRNSPFVERERERRCLSRCPSRNPCPNWITPLYCTTTRKDECGFLTGTQLHHSLFNSIGLMIILLHAHMLYVGPARAGPTRVQTFACTPSN